MDAKNIELVDTVINQFIKNYPHERYFRESDIVWTIQKKLQEKLKAPYKVFHEYPIKLLYPMKMTYKKWNDIIELTGYENDLDIYYHDESKNKVLNEEIDIDELKRLFSNIEMDGSYFEPCYTDLSIVNNKAESIDLDNKPEIVIQCKFEPDIKNRRGFDFRNNISNGINKKKDILYDMKIIDHCISQKLVKCGYLIMVDESNKFNEILSGKFERRENNVWIYKKSMK